MKRTFVIGALGYGALEMLWRGRTHPTMLLTGGAALCLMRRIIDGGRGIWHTALKCAAVITALELGVGLLVNKVMKWNVWDYSKRGGNLWGQICPTYCGLWLGLSLAVTAIYRFLFEKNRDIINLRK